MLYILFGLPAVGKDYIAKLLSVNYGFFHYNGDTDLTPEMLQSIHENKIFSQAMRDEYFKKLIEKIVVYFKQAKKIVITQGLAKETNRHQLKMAFPDAKFILINANNAIREKRLLTRNDSITLDYAQKIQLEFEQPDIPHHVIENEHDDTYVLQQLSQILKMDRNL